MGKVNLSAVKLPRIDAETLSDQQLMRRILNYLYQLQEQLRYELTHIDEENISNDGLDITALSRNLRDKIDGIESVIERYESITGEVMTIKKSADALEVWAQDTDENISSLTLEASRLAAQLEDAEDNIAAVELTAQGLSTRVQDAEDDIAAVEVTAQGLDSRVTNAEGDASRAVQTANSFSTIIGDRSGHTSSLTQEIDGLQSRISELGYGTVYMQPNEPSHAELVQGDIWIQSQQFTTWGQIRTNYTWRQVKALGSWQSLGGIPKMYVWDGSKWQEMYDAALPAILETEIEQLTNQIALRATKTELDALSQQVAQNTASITLTAEQVLTEAKSYVNGELTNYSTSTQTSQQISQYVTDNAYKKVSGINITSEGVEITGSQFVKIGSQGKLIVEAGNFKIDANGNVDLTGKVTATSGVIGGWTLGNRILYSGTGAGYVALDSDPADSYAIWAGNATAASAPFRVSRDGSVYLTKLYTVDENGSASRVNLYNTPLWKLNYNAVKSVDETTGTVTLTNGTTFKSARSVTLSGSWSGGILNVTASNGNGYSAALRQGVTDWSGNVATVYVNDVGQGGARSTGFTATVDATDLIESVTPSRVQYNGSQLNIYNDSEGSLSVRVYVALSNGASGTYTISVPYRCID